MMTLEDAKRLVEILMNEDLGLFTDWNDENECQRTEATSSE